MTLTNEERRKFAAWCRQEAADIDAMTRQMERLRVPTALLSRRRAEAMALTVAGAYLASWEPITVALSDKSDLPFDGNDQ